MNDAPGLQRRKRADGTPFFNWVALRASRLAKDYPLKTRRLSDVESEAKAQCRTYTAEMFEWLAARKPAVEYTGTIESLIDCYRHDEDSPYRSVKGNTRRDYAGSLKIIRDLVGIAPIAILTRKDFAKWHRQFLLPAVDGGPERHRRAWGCMKLLRTIASYGVSMRYEGCRDMRDILAEMRFEMPAPRESLMMFDQAAAIVDHALAVGRRSVALAQALQFETTLRQKDVIGEWTFEVRKHPTESQLQTAYLTSGITSGGFRWSGGVLWSDLSPDGILRKKTTKTKASSAWNLDKCPLVMKVLALYAPEERVGPMVVSETTGLPYRPDDFRVKWRAIADAAGVPRDVWNMDSRSGGLTEAAEAGAAIDDIRKHATHASSKMTSRYIRDNQQANERVATLRVASRTKGESK